MGALPRPIPGLCDRCGFRYPLCELKEEYVLGHPTNIYTCPECYDVSHPQLDTRRVKTNDKQTVKNSRSDHAELPDSRRLSGWKPVGNQGTLIRGYIGNVKVVIE